MFPQAPNVDELSKAREFKTVDIVRRLGVISPQRIHLKNHPLGNPVTAFNPAMIVNHEDVVLYARIILGYFLYVSAVVHLSFPLDDLYSGAINVCHYSSDIVVYPTVRYDLWGAEDPRVSVIDGKPYMVYVGRTINYFNPHIRHERTLPVLAVAKNRTEWVKTSVFVLPRRLRRHVISDKDAFIVKTREGDLLLFHRPHLDDEEFYLVISKVPVELSELSKLPKEGCVREIEVKDTRIVLNQALFELKLGWAAPPVEVEPNTFLALVHGIDREIECYRTFALLLKYDRDVGIRPIAVTPHYIMEPKTVYEVFGDRPYTVFPCGMAKLDNKLLIAYGAADSAIGIGELDLDELLSELDKARIE